MNIGRKGSTHQKGEEKSPYSNKTKQGKNNKYQQPITKSV